MAKTYAKVVGVALLLTGLAGFFMGDRVLMGMTFSMHHNIIHALTGVIGLWAGFGGSANAARMFALIFGAVYTLVAIWGFLGNADLGPLALNLNMPYNVVHLLIGLLGLIAGMKKPEAAPAAG